MDHGGAIPAVDIEDVHKQLVCMIISSKYSYLRARMVTVITCLNLTHFSLLHEYMQHFLNK